MFLYQQNQHYFAQIAEGLEDSGTDELRRLGAREIRPAYRGLHFEAEKAALYRINYQSRLVTRVLAPLAAFPCHEPDYLYRKAKLIPWKEIMGVDQTLAVFANLSNSKIRHSQYAGLCLKDAIVDHFREDCGRRPDVRRIDPDVWVNLFIENNQAVISLDTSGGSLHRRGYRREGVEAPVQETGAAAVICWTEWDGGRPLVDPMCGSGTLLAEALMHYCRVPAGSLRNRFGFERLPDFDRRLWASVKAAADRGARPLPPGLISGSDMDAEAVETARENLRRLPHGGNVALQRADVRRLGDLSERPRPGRGPLLGLPRPGRHRGQRHRLQPAVRDPAQRPRRDGTVLPRDRGFSETGLPGDDRLCLLRQPRDAQAHRAQALLEAAAQDRRAGRAAGEIRNVLN